MRMLAVETTETAGTVAGLESGRLVAEIGLPPHQRSSRSLAPGLRTLLGQLGWRPDQVGLVAVSIGPGSFTGLRIGVMTAKAFAYATGAQIIAVGTLDAIAGRAPDHVTAVNAVIDAHRRQVFAGRFARRQSGLLHLQGEVLLLDGERWLAGLNPGEWLTGPGLKHYADRIPQGIRVVDSALWSPTAATVGRIGWQRYQAGHRDDLWQLVPRYVRKSAAEEKWLRENREAARQWPT